MCVCVCVCVCVCTCVCVHVCVCVCVCVCTCVYMSHLSYSADLYIIVEHTYVRSDLGYPTPQLHTKCPAFEVNSCQRYLHTWGIDQ